MGKRSKKFSFEGQFAGRLVEMLRSPAYRVLSRAALLILTRLEIEHAQHAGRSNGYLPCTYANFEEFGIHKDAIAAGIREVVAMGFVAIAQPGVAGNADFRRPTLYRLTFFPTETEAATHDWRKFELLETAEAICKQARLATNPDAIARGKKQNPAPGFRPVSTPETRGENRVVPPPETGGTVPPPETGVTYISGAGARLKS